MSPMIYLDGVEKAGKTTIANILVEKYGATYQHFGLPDSPPTPFDLIFHEKLVEHTARAIAGELIVWDRGWASDHVYGQLLSRDTRLTRDPWLGEWLYGRVVRTIGVKAILTGPDTSSLEHLRTADDQPVEVEAEQRAFSMYGLEHGYDYAGPSHHSQKWQEDFALALVRLAWYRQKHQRMMPPDYVGPVNPTVLIIGEARSSNSTFAGSFAPFTSVMTTRFGRGFGFLATMMGWTNADVVTDDVIRSPSFVLACGDKAKKRVESIRGDAFFSPHPSYMYRWGGAEQVPDGVTSVIREFKSFLRV